MRYFPEKHEPILNLAPYDHLVGNILFDPGDTVSLFLRVAPIPFHLKGQTEKASIRRKLQALLNLLPEDVKLQVIYDRHCDIRGYLCNHALLLREARGKGHPLLPHIVGSRIGMYKDLASRERVFDEEIYVVVSRSYPQLRDFNREILTREDSPEAAARRWEGVFRGIFEDLRRLENLVKEGLGQVTSVEVPDEREIFLFLFRTISLSTSYFKDGFFRYVPFSIRPLTEQASALLELILLRSGERAGGELKVSEILEHALAQLPPVGVGRDAGEGGETSPLEYLLARWKEERARTVRPREVEAKDGRKTAAEVERRERSESPGAPALVRRREVPDVAAKMFNGMLVALGYARPVFVPPNGRYARTFEEISASGLSWISRDL
ncbi:MAG: hypothetical protein QXO86_06675 [Nitrososphaerota archaeon]